MSQNQASERGADATRSSGLRQAFAMQIEACAKLGSPFTARLLEAIEPLLDETTATGRKVLGWQGRLDALGDSVPLRLTGALHGMVREGRLPALAALYPPAAAPSVEKLRAVLVRVLRHEDEALLGWLRFTPQTNEVARASLLYAGLVEITRRTGSAIALYEIGSSAGLNLMLDRFAYELGGRKLGAAGSPVQLRPGWQGPTPAGPEPRILSRRGCDLAPLDILDEAQRRRLSAYVWADQAERLQRLEAAIAIALPAPPRLERADAADWIERRIGLSGEPGTARVVMHSIAYQYFPPETQRRIRHHLETVGAAATAQAPLAWLAFEQRGEEGPALTLRLWPDGEEEILARGDAHGRQVRWHGSDG
ncbi:DUF2332 domain-containing protein [Bosea sp. (in: a-proteobacteria)]|uniref:DUF2332 domain-containing protein n=1 Tax=Bosea sp. (in: a-proteobacteria) TaxID=1871050 RepID=UPI002FC95D87